MKKAIILVAISVVHFAVSQSAFAQFRIDIPKLPKIDKTRKDGNGSSANEKKFGDPAASKGKNIYENQRPTSTPVFLKNSVYIQATTHNEYWKVPNERNYSSWVPMTKFNQFFNNERRLNYTVEYFNPDGSAWYSEQLEQSSRHAADRTVSFESPSPYGGVLDTKSTVGTGLYSLKITNQDTKEILYQGKFKVGKFSTGGGPKEKKFDFFVDHDWLMPFGVIGFHHSDIDVGGMMPEASVWLKGPVDAAELEGRLFYKGQQIASSKDSDGASGVSDYDERTTQFAASHSPLSFWKRWQFQWGNFRFDNNGTFNRDYYPKAHYADKNPGDYTVKIYRSGAQIREMSFTIGADGKFVVPAYTNQIFMPYHRIVLPVKVIGSEKWDSVGWKGGAFYGNPLTGFATQ